MDSELEPSPEALEAGRLLFAADCAFTNGSTKLETIPTALLPEVAFAGRSNVGKSSLLNALTGRNTLARTSNTPGRTQQLNFFDLGRRLILVDMPGYGYAKAPKTQIAAWNALVNDFLRGRSTLRRVLVLIDARHGLMAADAPILKMLDQAAVSYQIVLTKQDKVRPNALAALVSEISAVLTTHTAAHPVIHATSAEAGSGIPVLRAALAALAVAPTVG